MTILLTNYLRTYRKRSGLTQDEVAYLLGLVSGSKVSRYELYRRIPNLETALTYEAIFRTPVRELFAGLFAEVEKKMLKRVGRLGKKFLAKPETPLVNAKLEALAVILRGGRATDRKQ
ncbi:MAG: helix-turn-helix transcriptional regulator [Acidobacteriales bacterium]|nr:helix-turn-helix transcriptional regulator [Terriglobales bacterium]